MTTIPVYRTWVAGEIVTAAELNSNIRDAGNFFLARPMALLRQTVAQSIPNNTNTPITFDTEDLDRDSGHSTSSNTSRYTSPTQGYFFQTGGGSTAASATGQRGVGWRQNGGGVNPVQTFMNTTAAGGWSGPAVPEIFFYNGTTDYTELYVFQNSGGALNTLVTAGGQAVASIFFLSS